MAGPLPVFFERVQCPNIRGKRLQEEAPWASWHWMFKLKCALSCSYSCTSVTISKKHQQMHHKLQVCATQRRFGQRRTTYDVGPIIL